MMQAIKECFAFMGVGAAIAMVVSTLVYYGVERLIILLAYFGFSGV